VIAHLTPAGTIHAVLALLCIVVGAVQLLRPKGDARHRAMGYAYVYAMLVADGTAMLVYRFTGQFNAFHVGAIVNFILIVLAMLPLLQNPRPANWKLRHYYRITWSCVGLIAAAVTELIVRTVRLTHEQGWTVSGGATVIVTAIGYVLIERHRPRSEAQPTETAKVQHEGAT
jgi:uncharacterized membrane protein